MGAGLNVQVYASDSIFLRDALLLAMQNPSVRGRNLAPKKCSIVEARQKTTCHKC